MEENEKRIKRITQIYYSNPEIQKAILEFSKDREVVPRYFEAFGKRPDSVQYPSDITGLVKKGATSFHASEELWADALKINSDSSAEELSDLRKGWDLLIDIDSPYLDYSKIAAKLMIKALESEGVKNYGLKFSGNKGFHIIVSQKAFPRVFRDVETRKMFPEWARAISEYLTNKIKPEYNQEVGKIMSGSEIKAFEKKTNQEISEVVCPECGRESKRGKITEFVCPECGMKIERKDIKLTNRKLKCPAERCPGVLELGEIKDYFYCEYCKLSSLNEERTGLIDKNWKESLSGGKIADLDLVLVSPRHLFRAPYSLHEKSALASIVISKEELENFSPKDANPLNVKIKNFLPKNEDNEASGLLMKAVEWKERWNSQEEEVNKKKYSDSSRKFDDIKITGVREEHFPKPIKKLLKGLKEGKKRGLFILLTFLKSLNFSPEYINNRIREWNKLNEPQLKEGYVKSQIEWHLKQKKKILPPNYNNQAFYKDLNLLEGEPKAKNPISEVIRALKKESN